MICSIIIRSYNEERHIGRLIDGILTQELNDSIEIEIILVDSGSTDSTVSIAKHMGATVVALSKEEFSFGRALNAGCEKARGEILLFASAHIYPIYTDWVNKMVLGFKKDDIAIVYGRQVGGNKSKFSEKQIFLKWFPKESTFNQKTPFCNNANCAIRKELWSKYPYDEKLTGLEDLWWAKRIMEQGYKIVYLADAVIAHIHEETPQKTLNRYRREAIAFKQIYPKEHFGFLDFFRLTVFNIISDLFYATKERLLIKQSLGIIIFRVMQFYGTFQGHKQKGEVSKELRNRFYYPHRFVKNKKAEELNTESKKIIYR